MLGLIPLAVGLAYLVFYYTDPSRKTGAGAETISASAGQGRAELSRAR